MLGYSTLKSPLKQVKPVEDIQLIHQQIILVMEHTAFTSSITVQTFRNSKHVSKCSSFTSTKQFTLPSKSYATSRRARQVMMSVDPASVGTGYAFLDSLKGVVIGPTINEITAAIAGGTVGVMGTIITLEVQRQRVKERKQCPYCRGTGKLPCATCCTIGAVPAGNTLTAQKACSTCGERGYLQCNHCDGDGRLIPWVYERAIRAQYEDYVYSPIDDYYQDEPPYV